MLFSITIIITFARTRITVIMVRQRVICIRQPGRQTDSQTDRYNNRYIYIYIYLYRRTYTRTELHRHRQARRHADMQAGQTCRQATQDNCVTRAQNSVLKPTKTTQNRKISPSFVFIAPKPDDRRSVRPRSLVDNYTFFGPRNPEPRHSDVGSRRRERGELETKV